MSFNPDKENSVEVQHSTLRDYHTAGAQGRPLLGKSVTADARPRTIRKPLGNVNIQRPADLPPSAKNSDKAPLKAGKPLQQSAESGIPKFGLKTKASELKPLKPAEISKPKNKAGEAVGRGTAGRDTGSSVDDAGATVLQAETKISSTTTSTAATATLNGEEYPEIEQLAFPAQEPDDLSDLWATVEKPDSYFTSLLGWRPSLFSSSISPSTADLSSSPSLSSSPLSSSAAVTTPPRAVEPSLWCEEPLSYPLPSVTLPDLDSLSEEEEEEEDGDKSIREDLLYFSALH